MKTTVKRIQTLDVTLPAEAGSLARIYSGFKEAGVNVTASWGYEMGPGQAQAHFYVPVDSEKAQQTLTEMGFKPVLNNACWVEGDDKLGAYAEVLGKIAKAGINIGATDAFAINGHFAAVLFTAKQDDFASLCKALDI